MVFLFFEQKTAYERRISDWSSDVCSSDLPVATAVMQIASEGKEASDRLLFIDVASGRIDTVTAGSSKSEFVAASPAARRAAFIDKSGNETLLMVADAHRSRPDLVRPNRHRQGVVRGTPVPLTHAGPQRHHPTPPPP